MDSQDSYNSSYSIQDLSAQAYLQEIRKISLLSVEQEKALARRSKQGDIKATNELITSNLKLVICIAKRYQHRGVLLADLIEEGNLGLMHAVQKFDPEREIRFSTYSTWWIRQYIERAIMNQSRLVRVPVYFIKKYSKFLKLKNDILFKQEKNKSQEELAEYLEVDISHLSKITEFDQYDVSIDTPSASTDLSAHDWLKDDNVRDPIEEIEKEETAALIEKCIARLSPQAMEVIQRRYGIQGYEYHTLEEVGKEINLTRERVRQIQKKALNQLRRECMMRGMTGKV